jgi:hypothetical protein
VTVGISRFVKSGAGPAGPCPWRESPTRAGLFASTGDVNGDGFAPVFALAQPAPEAFAGFGVAVSAGDLNWDGLHEVVAGTDSGDSAGVPDAGEAFVFVPQIDLGPSAPLSRRRSEERSRSPSTPGEQGRVRR